MKTILKIGTVIFLFMVYTSCSAQTMRTTGDAHKLKENEQSFTGKPLKDLLKQIGPKIKMVLAEPSTSSETKLGYFIFRFVDAKVNAQYRSENKFPLGITVFVKEPFVWDRKALPMEEKQTWTKDDAEKYGNLTVVSIRVYGEN